MQAFAEALAKFLGRAWGLFFFLFLVVLLFFRRISKMRENFLVSDEIRDAAFHHQLDRD